MRKGAEAFRSIGEVARLIGVAPHVLRYWETQFTLLKPMKRPDGRRYYRPEDVRLAAGLCEILRDEGLTIRGARKLIAHDRGEAVRALGATRLGRVLGSQVGSPPGSIAATDADFDEEDEVMSSGPRSRQRRRRPAAEDGHLPLFPEMAAQEPARGPAAVLAALQAMDRLPQQMIAPVERLRAAILSLDGMSAPR